MAKKSKTKTTTQQTKIFLKCREQLQKHESNKQRTKLKLSKKTPTKI
jgi:hypothetical protein